MTRGTVNKLMALGLIVAWAIIFGTAVHLIRQPSAPPINHCPPSDAANPWCGQ